MAQAASVNFQKITSTLHAVGHASRQVPPGYLMPANQSMGAHCLIDDQGDVHKTYKAKLALASRQAKKEAGYSPMWEGVLNLPDKADGESVQDYKSRCKRAVLRWCDDYQEMTQHKVLRADLHLDEGHLNEAGEVVFNPHAHIMCDRTNDAGRVIKISPSEMRRIQTMTARVTELKRGEDARITRRKHINSHMYKALAETNRLETQKAVEQAKAEAYKEGFEAGEKQIAFIAAKRIQEIRQEHKVAIDALEEKYRLERAALKASGEATQRDYQELKAKHQAAKAEAYKEGFEAGEKQTAFTAAKRIQEIRQEHKLAIDALKSKPQPATPPVQQTAVDVEARHAKRIANVAAWEARARLCAGAELILLQHFIQATKGKDKNTTIDGRAVLRAAQLEALRNTGQGHEAMVEAVDRHAASGIKAAWLLPQEQAIRAASRPPERSDEDELGLGW